MSRLAVADPGATDWMIAWGTIGGAVALVLTAAVALGIAIWGDALKRTAFKPRLDLSIEMRSPYCHKVQLVRGLTAGTSMLPDAEVMPPVPDQPRLWSRLLNRRVYDTYYFRLGVSNSGNSAATNVGVRILGLRTLDELTQTFVDDEDFRPFNLRWSHIRRVWLSRLEPHAEMMMFCDLAHVFKQGPHRLLELDTEVTPGQVREGVWPTKKPRGQYQLLLAITADDGYSVRRYVRVRYTGAWHDDATTMFRKAVQIKVQPPATRRWRASSVSLSATEETTPTGRA